MNERNVHRKKYNSISIRLKKSCHPILIDVKKCFTSVIRLFVLSTLNSSIWMLLSKNGRKFILPKYMVEISQNTDRLSTQIIVVTNILISSIPIQTRTSLLNNI